MQYITINSWDNFQHYKDRRPTWIKLLIEIIEEFDGDGNPKKYYSIPDNAKTTFLHLLCLRANYNDKIPYPNDKWLRKRLGLRRITLQPLVDAGFIIIDTESVSEPYSSVQSHTESVRQSKSKSKRESKSKSKRESKSKYSDSFQDFWKAFVGRWNVDKARHDKGGKMEAFEEWQKLDDQQQAKAMKAAPLTGSKITKDACRWLKYHRWEDFEDIAPKQNAVAEQKALERKRQEIRKEYEIYYREKTTDELRAMLTEKKHLSQRWLIKEILAKRKG